MKFTQPFTHMVWRYCKIEGYISGERNKSSTAGLTQNEQNYCEFFKCL